MTEPTTTCISCGMPLRSAEDHAKGDTSRPYCHHCAREDGSMKSYDEVLQGMTAFLANAQGLDQAVARTAAKGMMASLPAWAPARAQA
ncbi:MAG: zinc ribbon domain-containing protein [Myxococcales bacterium]|nr:zinc ribbon domain-containing protein [Myxococcales bacterium]